MELFRNSLQEHSLLSELAITEKMTRENNEPLDDLQLAALLGKTLLEKNEELESKLNKLQDFAKETILANQTLTRQLSEARDSLEYSNRLYEQLEVKLEESEASKSRLQKAHRTTQSLLEKKTLGLAEVDKDLLQLRLEREDLYSELDRLRADRDKPDTTRNSRSPKREKTPGMVGPFDGSDSLDDDSFESEQEEVDRLRKAVRELSVKLQSSVSRKNELEREVEELLADNTGLTQTLEKMEGEMGIYQQRLEEARERNMQLELAQEPATPPAMPKHRSVPFQSPLTSTSESNSSVNSGSTPAISALLRASNSATEPANKNSLFSELDQEYSSLQDKYQQLLDSCVCSVGQLQRDGAADMEHLATTTSTETTEVTTTNNSQGKFKELFDELFSTLRVSAQVADKLIESRSSRMNKK